MLFLFYAGLLITIVTWLVFIVMGFKTSAGWGVANVLVPYAQIAYAVKHWDIARLPLAAFLAGHAVFGVGAFGGGTEQLQAQMHEQGASLEELASLDMYRFGTFAADLEARRRRAEAAGIGDDAGVEDTLASSTAPEPEIEEEIEYIEEIDYEEPRRVAVRFDYRAIALGDLPANLRAQVKLQVAGGKVHEGTLLDANEDFVVLEKRLRGGKMEFEVRNTQILSAELWDRVSG